MTPATVGSSAPSSATEGFMPMAAATPGLPMGLPSHRRSSHQRQRRQGENAAAETTSPASRSRTFPPGS